MSGAPVDLPPMDAHNRRLIAAVHPGDWVNPVPAGRYNLVVIGAGTAGLVCAAGAAGLGAKVALIERHLMGGDCLNVGCVPSKALLAAAHAAADVRRAARFGVHVGGDVHVDFPAVMERLRRLRADIAPNDGAARFRDLGVDVFLGSGRFTGRDRVEVVSGASGAGPAGAADAYGASRASSASRTSRASGAATTELRFARAVIATGARAALPPIPGLAESGALTNETVFSLTELPARLAVLGGGPIGCELAQAFARFGSRVTLLETGPQVLGREDPDAAALVVASLQRDGVTLQLGCRTERVERRGAEVVLTLGAASSPSGDAAGGVRGAGATLNASSRAAGAPPSRELVVDALLVGVGRAPNVEGLGLEAADVAFDPRVGVGVDDHLRTSNAHVFAAGDICSPFKFTHAADFMARLVIQNALFVGRKRASALTIPWCTYTDPEVAHVGLTEREAVARGLAVTTFTQPLRENDRALLDGDEQGFVRVHLAAGSDRILGATIVARHAGEMIGELTLAMTAGLGLGRLASTIHSYPTQADAIRRTGDLYNRTRLTPFVKGLFRRWLAMRR